MDVTVSELLELFLQSPLVTWVSLQSGPGVEEPFAGQRRADRALGRIGVGGGEGKKFGMGGKRLPSWRTGPGHLGKRAVWPGWMGSELGAASVKSRALGC